MKTFSLIVLFATVATMARAARVCVIDARNCNSKVSVCGRFGQSNLCQKFTNLCYLQSANCAQTAQYTRVSSSMCNGIALNTRRACRSVNSANTGTGTVGLGTGVLANGGLSNAALGNPIVNLLPNLVPQIVAG